MKIITTVLGLIMGLLLLVGTVSALDLSAKADVNANSDSQEDSSDHVGVFAKMAAFFRGEDKNETHYEDYNETYNEESDDSPGIWANIKAFFTFG